jgi:peroxiredoxin
VLLIQRGFGGDFACFFCGQQTRAYKSAYHKLAAAGAEVLMVLPGATDAKGYLRAVGESDEEKPDPNLSVPFLVVCDPDYSACIEFEIPYDPKAPGFPVSNPATFVLAKDGTVLYSYRGKDPSDRPPVDTVLEVLKTGKAPAAAAVSVGKPPSESSLAWMAYEEGMKAARDQKKPVLIDFYADW